jgi:hypothetical protein
MTLTYAANAGDLRLTATLNRDIKIQLADFTDLVGAGIITNRGDAAGSGSSTHKLPIVDYSDAMTAPTEGADVAATAVSSSNVTIAVARQALRHDVSDLFGGTGGPLGYRQLAQKMAVAASLRRTDMVATLFGSLSNSVGTPGVDMSIDDFYDAIIGLEQNSVGMMDFGGFTFASVLAPIQWTDCFRTSLRGETGALVERGDVQAALSAKGPGFKGVFAEVGIWTSDSCATNGGNREGAMFGAGCFGYREMSVGALVGQGIPGFNIEAVDPTSPIWVEWERNALGGETFCVGNYYFGVSEEEDGLGRLISTDA